MRDVISSYAGKSEGSRIKILVYLSIIFLIIVALTYALYKPWITDFSDRSEGKYVFSFQNVGNIDDDDIYIELNSSLPASCNFTSKPVELKFACRVVTACQPL